MKGGKSQVWEGGFRVPCIVWWPGTILAGRVSDEIATQMDLYPTFVARAGAELPADRVIDGKNIWPLLVDQEARSPHEEFYYYHKGALRAVRSGPWKLLINKVGRAGPLFNLEDDIGENRNVRRQHPEVYDRLLELAESAREELGDVPTSTPGKGNRPVGRYVE